MRDQCLRGRLAIADAFTAFDQKPLGQLQGTPLGFASSGLCQGKASRASLFPDLAQRNSGSSNTCKRIPQSIPVFGSLRSYVSATSDPRFTECGWTNAKASSARSAAGGNPLRARTSRRSKSTRAQQSPIDSVLIDESTAGSSNSATPNNEDAEVPSARQAEGAASTSHDGTESNGRGGTPRGHEAGPKDSEVESASIDGTERGGQSEGPGTTTSSGAPVGSVEESGSSGGDQEYARELEVRLSLKLGH